MRKPKKADAADFSRLPAPPAVASTAEPYGILVTGIGGTGVVTIGALLGMAAHLEDKGVSVLDMTGLAQKNGSVAPSVPASGRASKSRSVRRYTRLTPSATPTTATRDPSREMASCAMLRRGAS